MSCPSPSSNRCFFSGGEFGGQPCNLEDGAFLGCVFKISDNKCSGGGMLGGTGLTTLWYQEIYTTIKRPLFPRPPGVGRLSGVVDIIAGGAPARISTTPVDLPAPGGLRSKGRLMVVDISLSHRPRSP